MELEPECRAIFVLGPSSSGKTTLCDALAETLQIKPPQYIKEVARNVMKTYGFTRDHTDTYEMQHAIMSAQLVAEEKAISAAIQCSGNQHPLILGDRSAVDPIVYAAASTVPGALERRQRLVVDEVFQKRIPFYQRSIFVVLGPVREWVEDDGVRSLEDPWRYSEELHRTLAGLGIAYIKLGEELKDLQGRVHFVVNQLRCGVQVELPVITTCEACDNLKEGY